LAAATACLFGAAALEQGAEAANCRVGPGANVSKLSRPAPTPDEEHGVSHDAPSLLQFAQSSTRAPERKTVG
jgi:hypothetical protein